jgi:hypothetical protein
MSEAEGISYTDSRTNCNNPYQFQPVTLVNGVGTIALSIIATLLTIALLRSHKRNRELGVQLADREPKGG